VPLPEIDDPGIKIAGYSTVLGALFAIGWKLRLWMLGDLRNDHAASRDDKAGSMAQQVLEGTIERLQKTIARMDEEATQLRDMVERLEKRLDVEVQTRYAAEASRREAEYRLHQLESELAVLKAKQA
jgi:DNA-binding MurR/RpiR family transcriptional regulator